MVSFSRAVGENARSVGGAGRGGNAAALRADARPGRENRRERNLPAEALAQAREAEPFARHRGAAFSQKPDTADGGQADSAGDTAKSAGCCGGGAWARTKR